MRSEIEGVEVRAMFVQLSLETPMNGIHIAGSVRAQEQFLSRFETRSLAVQIG